MQTTPQSVRSIVPHVVERQRPDRPRGRCARRRRQRTPDRALFARRREGRRPPPAHTVDTSPARSSRLQRDVPDVFGDADDRGRRTRSSPAFNRTRLSIGFAVRPVTVRHVRLMTTTGSAWLSSAAANPPAHQRNPHRLEIVRRDVSLVDDDWRFCRRHRPPLNLDAVRVARRRRTEWPRPLRVDWTPGSADRPLEQVRDEDCARACGGVANGVRAPLGM